MLGWAPPCHCHSQHSFGKTHDALRRSGDPSARRLHDVRCSWRCGFKSSGGFSITSNHRATAVHSAHSLHLPSLMAKSPLPPLQPPCCPSPPPPRLRAFLLGWAYGEWCAAWGLCYVVCRWMSAAWCTHSRTTVTTPLSSPLSPSPPLSPFSLPPPISVAASTSTSSSAAPGRGGPRLFQAENWPRATASRPSSRVGPNSPKN